MRRSLFVLAALVLCSGPAHGSNIVLTGDLGSASCPTLPLGVVTRVYVVATLPGDACGGIKGFELRITGFPTQAEGWFHVVQWPLGIPPSDDLFGAGVRLEFACVAFESGVVPLLAIDVVPLTPIFDRQVSVVAHQTPSVPGSTCPRLTLCDDSSICVNGSVTYLNDTFGYRCYCNDGCIFPACPPLAVETGTWSQVKLLYQP